jgi:PAS domain S-box-containing protein
MVHVEKIKVKGNVYYKLVHSIRKGGKVKSKSKYLGKVLPPPKTLEKLKKKFYQEVLQHRLKSAAATQSIPLAVSIGEKHSAIPPKKIPSEQHLSLHEEQDLVNLSRGNYMELLAPYLSEVFYLADPISLEISYMSPVIETLFGYPTKYWLVGTNLWGKIIYPPDRKQVLSALQQSRENKTSIDINYRVITKDSKIITVLHKIIWRTDDQGNLINLIGIIKDISSEKEINDTLLVLFDESPAPLMELDYSRLLIFLRQHKLKTENDIVTYFEKNPLAIQKVQRMVSIKRVNSPYLRLINAENKNIFIETYLNKKFLRDTDEVFIKELVAIVERNLNFESLLNMYTLDGKKIEVVLKWSVPHTFKSDYGGVMVTVINTSMQKALAKMMHIKNSALEASPSGLLITDLVGKINYANHAFFDLWHIQSMGNVIGESVVTYLNKGGDGMKILQKVHIDHEWRGNIIIGGVKATYLQTHGGLVVDEYDEPLGMVFSFIDITELKRSEQIRLEFTNIAAHELKTPVVPIKTLLTMIYEDPHQFGINEEGMKHLFVCLRNVNRLNILIGDILDISRLEAGGMKFSMAKYNLLDVVKNVLEDYTENITKAGLKLRQTLPENLPLVYGDGKRISQVIGNLIKNAVNFTSVGSIFIKVVLKNDEVEVKITDTGSGIPPLAQEKLFTKFYQVEDITTRKTKGTGLGLAISKGIIEHHGGKMYVFSEGTGSGSTFSFTVPIKGPTQAEGERKKEKGHLMGEKLLLDKVPKPFSNQSSNQSSIPLFAKKHKGKNKDSVTKSARATKSVIAKKVPLLKKSPVAKKRPVAKKSSIKKNPPQATGRKSTS